MRVMSETSERGEDDRKREERESEWYDLGFIVQYVSRLLMDFYDELWDLKILS